MSSPPALRAIFATPFASLPLSSGSTLNPALAALLRARTQPEQREPSTLENALTFRSREDLFGWADEPMRQLQAEMLGALAAIVNAASLYPEDHIARLRLQARARFVVVRPDGCLAGSAANNCSWCMIYCVAAPRPPDSRWDSGAVRLFDLRMRTGFVDAGNAMLRPAFNVNHHIWQPTPGYMTAFPSGIGYEVALNRTPEDVILVIARARLEAAGQESALPW